MCFAQHAGSFGQSANPANKSAYFTSADFSLTSDISGSDVFVGKSDTAVAATNFLTQNPVTPVTLTIASGGKTTAAPTTQTYPDGNLYSGISAFGNNNVAITGGDVTRLALADTSSTAISGGTTADIFANNSSRVNISSGTVNYIYANNAATQLVSGGTLIRIQSRGSSVANISGGNLLFVEMYDSTLLNLSGSTITYLYGRNNSVLNITNGSVTDSLNLFESSIANFFGQNLNAVYSGFSSGFDSFTVTGNYNDIANTPVAMTIRIRNTTGTGNSTFRQVNFNPVIVPESGTMALVLPLLAVVGARVVRRRIMSA